MNAQRYYVDTYIACLDTLSCKVASKYLCARASLTRYQVNNAQTDVIRGSEGGKKPHLYVMTMTQQTQIYIKKIRNLD